MIDLPDFVSMVERSTRLIEEGAACPSLVNGNESGKIPDLLLVRRTYPSHFESSVYSPVMCMVLQGAKETIAGMQSALLAAGEVLVVSHDLPVETRVIGASPSRPYLAVFMPIDLEILRSLSEQVGIIDEADVEAVSLDTAVAEPELIDALARYLSLPVGSLEAQVITPLIQREIHFRLLAAPIGRMLRNLLRVSGHANKIAQSIKQLRENFRKPLTLPVLALGVGMSTSSFHAHFKAVTGTTPLQYQKDLRLIEAKRLLLTESITVTSAALVVGYESMSQFSREYSRKFGVSPSADVYRKAV